MLRMFLGLGVGVLTGYLLSDWLKTVLPFGRPSPAVRRTSLAPIRITNANRVNSVTSHGLVVD